jgi:hypothetical protein
LASAVGAHRLEAELCQALAKAFRVPSAGVEPTEDPVTMICRIRWACTTVPRGIAEPAGGDDVVGAIAATVLAGDEVLGRALQPRGFAVAEAERGGKFSWVLEPHGEAAVVAAAILAVERGTTVFGKRRSGHDRLLKNISRHPIAPWEVEPAASRLVDLAQAQPVRYRIWPPQSLLQALLRESVIQRHRLVKWRCRCERSGRSQARIGCRRDHCPKRAF